MTNQLRHWWLTAALLVPLLAAQARPQSTSLDEQLLAAAAKGDVAAVTALLTKGANVNADNGHGVTPLWYAADKGNLDLVKLLLDHGADINAKDLEYGRPPLRLVSVSFGDLKAEKARADIVKLLVDKGAGTEGESLDDLIRAGYVEAVQTIVSRGGADPGYLNSALAIAKRGRQTALAEFLVKAGAKDPGPTDSARSPARLKLIAGTYRNQSGQELTLKPNDDELLLERAGQEAVALLPTDLTLLRSYDLKVVVTLKPGSLPPIALTVKDGARRDVFTRTTAQ
jgi:ankyrin repeat protein